MGPTFLTDPCLAHTYDGVINHTFTFSAAQRDTPANGSTVIVAGF